MIVCKGEYKKIERTKKPGVKKGLEGILILMSNAASPDAATNFLLSEYCKKSRFNRN